MYYYVVVPSDHFAKSGIGALRSVGDVLTQRESWSRRREDLVS